jgi:radical SAM superfamily enzyme YgiQ (UPF0313 family)
MKSIYLYQYESGTSINLLPLSIGQIYSALKGDERITSKFNLEDIVFIRPESVPLMKFSDPAIAGFSCFLWNKNISLETAKKIKTDYPDVITIVGGAGIPKDDYGAKEFLIQHPYIDLICIEEGEKTFLDVCNHVATGNYDFSNVPGLLYLGNGELVRNQPESLDLSIINSPYVDGTFDVLYKKYKSAITGAILETNRGCPYSCTFCTWGTLVHKKIREKPIDLVQREIEWIARNKIKYVALCDANFGIRERDVEFAKLIAEAKRKFGYPQYISVSWVKNQPQRILEISEILKAEKVGFKITQAYQSLNSDVISAIKRKNIKHDEYKKLNVAYSKTQSYSYTELILGLPKESYESFIAGIENSLSDSLYTQIYVYLCFLFPNTEMSSQESRSMYKIQSRLIPNRYTKSKEQKDVKEDVEIVIGTNSMPPERWRDAFVHGYMTLAFHNARLLFFILVFLKREFSFLTAQAIIAMENLANQSGDFPNMKKAFQTLRNVTKNVQENSGTHLIDVENLNIPYDAPEGMFLNLIQEKKKFFKEVAILIPQLLEKRGFSFDKSCLAEVILFQESILIDPDNSIKDRSVSFEYDWLDYFKDCWMVGENEKNKDQKLVKCKTKVVFSDPDPACGDLNKYINLQFDVRGVPPFSQVSRSMNAV